MVTFGYDPTSVKDYMNAEVLLCDYRASDPMARREEEEEDEGDELEELDEKAEIGGIGAVGEDGEYDERDDLSDIMNELNDREEERDEDDSSATLENESSDDNSEENDNGMEDEDESDDSSDDDSDDSSESDDSGGMDHEVGEGQSTTERTRTEEEVSAFFAEKRRRENIYRIRCEDEGIHGWLVRRGWRCIEEYLEYHGMSYYSDSDCEATGAFIKTDILREMEESRAAALESAGAGIDAGGMDLDNVEMGGTQSGAVDRNQVAGKDTATLQANGAENQPQSTNYPFSVREIEEQIHKLGWDNLETFMLMHQSRYSSYEEALWHGRMYERFVGERKEIIEQQGIEKGLLDLRVDGLLWDAYDGGGLEEDEGDGDLMDDDDEEMTG